MVDSNKKGDRRERELINKFDEHNFAAMRAPASGSATERELPDVFAGNQGDFYAIEVKASSGDPIYVDQEEVIALSWFAGHWGAKARIGVRFDYDDWYLVAPGDMHKTRGGNHRIKQENQTIGERLDAILGDGDAE